MYDKKQYKPTHKHWLLIGLAVLFILLGISGWSSTASHLDEVRPQPVAAPDGMASEVSAIPATSTQ